MNIYDTHEDETHKMSISIHGDWELFRFISEWDAEGTDMSHYELVTFGKCKSDSCAQRLFWKMMKTGIYV